MADQRFDDTPPRDEDLTPQDPPDSMLHHRARRAVVMSYFVPIVVLFAVIGVALVFWSNRPDHSGVTERSEIGTVGRSDGGFNPAPRPDDPRAEIRYRGDDLSPITRVGDLRDVNLETMTGRRVRLDEAKVERTSDRVVWIGDDDRQFAVIVPDGSPTIASGATVAINGRVEPDAQGAVQVIADQIQVKEPGGGR
jgi:hypothetical protein